MKKQSPQKSDELRLRVLQIKDRLPRKYTERLKAKFPKYNKKGMDVKVWKVVSLQLVDEEIINDLEKIIL